MTHLPPRQPGYFLFNGTRKTTYRNQYVSVCEPIKVVEIQRTPRQRELAVKLIGRQQSFPLAHFSGTWQRIATEVTP